jgi:GGDEF domain-containing protein
MSSLETLNDDTDGLTNAGKRPLTLFLVEVDHGAPAGYDVMKAVGDTLSRAFPRSHLVAGYRREEVALIFSDGGEAEVARVAERLLHVVRGLRVTVSAGAAVEGENETPAELIERAGDALARSKRAGRNRWCVAPSSSCALDAAAE